MAVDGGLFIIVAIGLLILGIIGSVTPMIPGAILSVAGVLLYWWSTGYTNPSLFFVALTVLVGVAAFLTDYFAGAISAKVGGASTGTTIAAAAVSLVLFFVLGPLGVIVGVAGTVFLLEFWRGRRAEDSFRAAAYTTVGMLGSTAVQVIITVSILIGFLLALFF